LKFDLILLRENYHWTEAAQ